MTIGRLISGLEKRDILLSLAGDEIRYRSPKNALTIADKEALRARRSEIVDYLQTRAAARGLRAAGGIEGPLTPSVAQEMWRAFAGGPGEGRPVALNIGMAGKFHHPASAVIAAIRQLIARYDALRVRFEARDGALLALLNPADSLVVEEEDLRHMSAEAADQVSAKAAQAFCAQVNLIEGQWLTRAKVFALPQRQTLAVLSSAHMIADAGTRNIVLDELHDLLEHGAPQASPSLTYNDYSLAEREFLAGPQGERLIEYWRGWYHNQPLMKAPADGAPLLWGNGIRIVKNFTIPCRIADRVRGVADQWKVTPFLIYFTIFSIAMARWSGTERFPIRVLGDKRTALELTNTVGLMFCADAVDVHAPATADFETIMRGLLAEYDTARALRIPSLHFWAPYCVRPGIEAADYPNRIPAVFNYYTVGTARERAEKKAEMPKVAQSWPPEIETLPPQNWPRRSSPLFLHVMDMGHEAAVSLHFFQGAVSPTDQDRFTALLFDVFAEAVPA
jgi:hypothetical protein